MSWFRGHTDEWYQTPALKSTDFIMNNIREGRDGEHFGQNRCMLCEVVSYNKEHYVNISSDVNCVDDNFGVEWVTS